jgi:hypothetical protein
MGRRKRPEVKGPILLHPPGNGQARIRFLYRHPEARILLVIPKNDVVPRHKLLDEIAFKDECLFFGRSNYEIKIRSPFHH